MLFYRDWQLKSNVIDYYPWNFTAGSPWLFDRWFCHYEKFFDKEKFLSTHFLFITPNKWYHLSLDVISCHKKLSISITSSWNDLKCRLRFYRSNLIANYLYRSGYFKPHNFTKNGLTLVFEPGADLEFSRGGGGFSKNFPKFWRLFSFRSTKLIFRALPKHCFAPILGKFCAPQANFWKNSKKSRFWALFEKFWQKNCVFLARAPPRS